jgi:anaerobic ribonucleoside-triphosphate reductase activating protein
MPEVTGCAATVSGRVWDSLHLLVDAGVDLQLRTTLWRDSVISQHLPELQHLVSEQGFDLVIQQARAADGSPFQLV